MLSKSQEAAAFHGIATNVAHPVQDRLQAALQSLEWYEAEVELLRNEIQARINADDYDPAPIILEYDRMATQVMAWRDRAVAQDMLLACYRTHREPSEKLHRELERTRAAIHALGET